MIDKIKQWIRDLYSRFVVKKVEEKKERKYINLKR